MASYTTMADRADTAGSWRRQPAPNPRHSRPGLAAKPRFPDAPKPTQGGWDDAPPGRPTVAARGAVSRASPLVNTWAAGPPGLSNITPSACKTRGNVDNAITADKTSRRWDGVEPGSPTIAARGVMARFNASPSVNAWAAGPPGLSNIPPASKARGNVDNSITASPKTSARPTTLLAPNGRLAPGRTSVGNAKANRAPRIVVRDGKVYARHQPPVLRAILPALYGRPMTPDDLKELWASGKPMEPKPLATRWADEPQSDMPFPF